MSKLNTIHLLNAGGFDDVTFPVAEHCQVFGVNGHGKSTLLRTILFFYLGTNEKAPYALHDTKSDFVSYYLGNPPSYLIYEIARGQGQPNFHIAVTRPAGRIQFHFVDAPYRKEYYLESAFVRPVESVQQTLREAGCHFETYGSYEDFSHRVYGLIPSPFSVFRPATRSSGQISVLPRIISGIFTVSQLDADKLKAALTCGVGRDTLATELDLALLKTQLENFRRVNRAVTTYLRYEQDAIDLVELSADFETIESERDQAIENLVRSSKLLPQEIQKLKQAEVTLNGEQSAAQMEFENEKAQLDAGITDLGNQIAVIDANIERGSKISDEYLKLEIERKAEDIDRLPEIESQKRQADEEYALLTAAYSDESERKQRLLDSVHRSWVDLNQEFQKRKTAIERNSREALEQIVSQKEEAQSNLQKEKASLIEPVAQRRRRLESERSAINSEFKKLGEVKIPSEISETDRKLREADKKAQEEHARQDRLRGKIALAKEIAKTARANFERDAKDGKTQIENAILELQNHHERAEKEVEAFDASLAQFFQSKVLQTWPQAAKTFSREVLFRSAEELQAKVCKGEENSAWGVRLTTDKLPEPTESYDRNALLNRIREIRGTLGIEKDKLQAAAVRFLAEADALEKRSAAKLSGLEEDLSESAEVRSRFLDESARLEGHLLTLRSQFDASKRKQKERIDKREVDWKKDYEALLEEEVEFDRRFAQRAEIIGSETDTRRRKLETDTQQHLSHISSEIARAKRKRDDEISRIETDFQKAVSKKGANAPLIAAAKKRITDLADKIQTIVSLQSEVAEYRKKKIEWIEPLPTWRSKGKSLSEARDLKVSIRTQLQKRHNEVTQRFTERRKALDDLAGALEKDEQAIIRFKGDSRFMQEWGLFDREDLAPVTFFRAGAVGDFLSVAESAHNNQQQTGIKGSKQARAFLNHFDSETLDRKVLGFSPIHDYFDWFIFVGSELRPFVNKRGIAAMKRIQTQEFEQLIRNICNKNADFRDGVRQVNQTATLVQAHLADNNFVDVLDSIELKVERVDNDLTRTLSGMEEFADVSFGAEQDLFGKRADSSQVDLAIGAFENLLRQIENYRCPSVSLTDYFDFLIRVHENGHDMGWRKSLDHIGSTGTDYLVKMLIYLSLIEVYRQRAIDPKDGSAVHCVLDETGVLAPKYIKSVLEYAASRGITLVTAGHSQQTTGFQNWVCVRKRGQRFTGQTVLRKVLKCD